jgi:AcrR family transcriptional regulator
MTTSRSGSAPRALRVDAQRSRDRIIKAATALFIRDGADASLEEIARTAGVGSATLHRHFPSRWNLLEAVFADGIADLCAQAEVLARGDEDGHGLFEWLRSVCVYCAETRGLAATLLLQSDGQAHRAVSTCHQALTDAGAALVDNARDAGTVRPGITITDLLTLVTAIALAAESTPTDSARLLNLAIDGIGCHDQPRTRQQGR